MPDAPKPLRVRALQFPAKKRMSLATQLLESFDDEPELDSALLSELKQRAADLRSGKVKGLSTEAAYGFSL